MPEGEYGTGMRLKLMRILLAVLLLAPAPRDMREVRLSLPKRPADAPTGSAFRDRIATRPLAERETAVIGEITRGNVPEFLRRLKPIAVECTDETGARHAGTCFVTADYLGVGSDEDFFRIPLTPQAAVAIADAAGGTLLTAKLSDDVFRAADLNLEPKPLTQDRESVATFFQHHQIIEDQLRGKPRGALVAGIKKDIVWTNRLQEKPRKVAIYGWHYPDGRPIQPLYVGHWDRYVDYSHGLRLLAREMVVDGRTVAVTDVLRDGRLRGLVTCEGPTDIDQLRRTSEWDR